MMGELVERVLKIRSEARRDVGVVHGEVAGLLEGVGFGLWP